MIWLRKPKSNNNCGVNISDLSMSFCSNGLYSPRSFQYCSIEAFRQYIKQVNNLGRLIVIRSYIDCNIKLRVITNIRIEVAFNERYNIRNSVDNTFLND